MQLTNINIDSFKLELEGTHTIVLDTHETLLVDLGINRVIISKDKDGWNIHCNNNIKIHQYNTKEVFNS